MGKKILHGRTLGLCAMCGRMASMEGVVEHIAAPHTDTRVQQERSMCRMRRSPPSLRSGRCDSKPHRLLRLASYRSFAATASPVATTKMSGHAASSRLRGNGARK